MLPDARTRAWYPGLEHALTESKGRDDQNRALSELIVGQSRRMVICSAHVPNRCCAAGLQDVRLITRHIDGGINAGTTGVAGDCRPEECARHRCERSEAPQEASAREGLRSRSDMYRVGRTAAVVHDLKDRVSYDDDDRNSGTTGEAGSGRCETWSRQVMRWVSAGHVLHCAQVARIVYLVHSSCRQSPATPVVPSLIPSSICPVASLTSCRPAAQWFGTCLTHRRSRCTWAEQMTIRRD